MRDFNSDGVVVGRPYQDIFAQSASQKYPIGTIHERHGRRFRYCKASGDGVVAGRGRINGNIIPGDTGGDVYGIEKNLYAPAPIGSTKVTVENPGTTCFPVDHFMGGLMVVFATGTTHEIFGCRISGNELFTATSGIVYLDEAIPVDMSVDGTGYGAGGYGVNLHPSPYSRVMGANGVAQDYESFVVVPHVNVTDGYYFWGQTRGPCWVTPTGAPNTWPGYGAGGRDVYFHTDGTVMQTEDRDLSTYSPQRAGYVLPASATATYGDGVIMLMLE